MNKFLDSIVVTDISVQTNLGALVGPNKSFELLYRGSRDGFLIKDASLKIDNKGSTLVIIKSDYKKIFGGYTPIEWKRVEKPEFSMKDGSSFVFSLRSDNSITKLENIDGLFEVVHDPDLLLSFYSAIGILDQCNESDQNYTDLSVYY